MSLAILKTFLMVSFRNTGPDRRFRILLTLETSSPTRWAISTCVTIRFPPRGDPRPATQYGDCRKIGSGAEEVKAIMGKFTHKNPRGAGHKKYFRFCLRPGKFSIVISQLSAGWRRHEFWG